jgi:pimeloyl-ACP methyl ester carboxylesterase
MPYFHAEKDNAKSIKLYYEDLGTGKPVILISGWPLCSLMWEYQITQLTQVTTQAGVNILGLGGTFNTAAAASEGFDEPLTAAQVMAIVDPFIV